MKIGLLTYHHSSNIGAMVQTYATCRALKELGHDVVIVDIRQKEEQRQGLGRLASNIIFFVRNQKYKAFMRTFYPPLTRHYYSLDELRNDPPQVNCLVVGSDQTWNPDISKDVTMAYFLDFAGKDIRRVSYASSFGKSRWNENPSLTENVKKALSRFDSVSVREQTGVSICKDVFGINSKLVVDPTILFKSYSEITGPIKERREMVCYKLQRNDDFYQNIGKIKAKLGLPVALLNNAYPVRGLKYIYPPSVAEWIIRIGGARLVVTDSFHGVVFSLLYKRQFVAVKNHNGKDSRLVDLLCGLGLESRIFENVAEISETTTWCQTPIDYNEISLKIEKLRQYSWEYLASALS